MKSPKTANAAAKSANKSTDKSTDKSADKSTDNGAKTFYEEMQNAIIERRVLNESARRLELAESEAICLAGRVNDRKRHLAKLDELVVPNQKKVSLLKPLAGAAIITGTLCVGLYAADLAYRAALKKTGLDNIS